MGRISDSGKKTALSSVIDLGSVIDKETAQESDAKSKSRATSDHETLNREYLLRTAQVEDPADVFSVNLVNSNVKSIDEFDAVQFTHLQELDAGENSGLSFHEFGRFPVLKYLTLPCNGLSTLNIKSFDVGFAKLETLDLSYNGLFMEDDMLALGLLPNLKTLLLASNNFYSFPRIDPDTHFKKLLILDMEGNRITRADSILFMGYIENLTALNLNRNGISVFPNIHDSLNCFKNLQELYLSKNKFRTIDDLEPLKNIIKLKGLVIDGNPVCGKKGLSPYQMQTLMGSNQDLRIFDVQYQEKPIKSKHVQSIEYKKAGLRPNEWQRFQIVEKPVVVRRRTTKLPFPVESTATIEESNTANVSMSKFQLPAEEFDEFQNMPLNPTVMRRVMSDGRLVSAEGEKKRSFDRSTVKSAFTKRDPIPATTPNQSNRSYSYPTVASGRSSADQMKTASSSKLTPDQEGPRNPESSPSEFFLTGTKIMQKKPSSTIEQMRHRVVRLGDPEDPNDNNNLELPKMPLKQAYKLLFKAMENPHQKDEAKTRARYLKTIDKKKKTTDLEFMGEIIDNVYTRLSMIEINMASIMKNDYLLKHLPESDTLLKEIQQEYDRIKTALLPDYELPMIPPPNAKKAAQGKNGDSEAQEPQKSPIQKIQEELTIKSRRKSTA